ncbi:protection of telomeres protein 1a isoform X2 [Amborella trichopoda]|uniref:protection of telomeres protein 1a isoform X2 n=1 Tax=Amborella trichopoda TaxID=13333 RepID=UPI0009BFB27C|nr:protection of telomeres protein 1a isoform X2 [Amborella trichopoda]|eukprot:XP_020530361.1 protection of telomeres protein 1a isoform X2 [Amborella trichopoda]
MDQSKDIVYTDIRDAISCINQKVNIFGVVKEFGMPKKSKGTDFVCRLEIMDMSRGEPVLPVTFFAPSMEKLPHVKSNGDIIRLHRVLVKYHLHKSIFPYLLGLINIFTGEVYARFNKKFSSFSLFEGKSGKRFIPYQFSSSPYITDHDRKYITQLRTWLKNFEFQKGHDKYLTQFSGICHGKYCDLVCKILHICKVSEDETVVVLWDGTDTPPIPLETNHDIEAEQNASLQSEPFLPRDVLSTFPSIGSVVRVSIGKSLDDLLQQLQTTCQWVRFRKVKIQPILGFWQVVLLPNSTLCPLSMDDHFANFYQSAYETRISSSLLRMPYSCVPAPSPITHHQDAPLSSLREILTHAKVTYKYKCIVRVIAIDPRHAADFFSKSSRSPVYAIRMTLEDPTARIHANLFAEDGEKFFGGYPPTDELQAKVNKLLGVTEDSKELGVQRSVKDHLGDQKSNSLRGPLWVECCIKSYYLDKSNPWETRQYRIFGTRMGA